MFLDGSEGVGSIFSMKSGCLQLTTLSGIYMDEISHCIEIFVS